MNSTETLTPGPTDGTYRAPRDGTCVLCGGPILADETIRVVCGQWTGPCCG